MNKTEALCLIGIGLLIFALDYSFVYLPAEQETISINQAIQRLQSRGGDYSYSLCGGEAWPFYFTDGWGSFNCFNSNAGWADIQVVIGIIVGITLSSIGGLSIIMNFHRAERWTDEEWGKGIEVESS